MPKKKRKPGTLYTEVFNDTLCAMARVKLKPTEWQFLMALWRLTWGRKNMPHKESGKYTTWSPAAFIEMTGLDKSVVSRTKKDLLDKKVLIKKGELIGFNKHTTRWKLTKQSTDSSRLNSQQELTKQSTGVDRTVNKSRRSPSGTTNVPGLKKERKKETYSTEFEEVWKRYPKGQGKHPSWVMYKRFVITRKDITHDALVELLELHRPRLLAKIKEDGSDQYIKGFGPWLNSRPWDDDRGDSPSGASYGESKERLIYLNTKRRSVKLSPAEYNERIELETLMRSKKS